METLIIVARDSMLTDLEALLHENGGAAYTILSNVRGKGITGRGHETFLSPGINTIIFTVLQPDQVDRAVSALKALQAGRNKAARKDQPVPLKVFWFPCEEHV
ncbi:MAG: hypothetical protein U0236_08190 [Nitrospira sp.]